MPAMKDEALKGLQVQPAPLVAPADAPCVDAPDAASSSFPEFPGPLREAEKQLIDARRRACGQDTAAPHIGMGLSGGGIRSATFCYGVFQALAERSADALPRFSRIDYLSTVSGGGYFGSFLGSLFRRKWVRNADHVAEVLQGKDGPAEGQRPARLLRDNGRYLAPRGSGDVLVMIAVAVRNWVAVQCVMIAFVLAAFVLLQLLRTLLPDIIAGLLGKLAALVAWTPGVLQRLLEPLARGAAAIHAWFAQIPQPDVGGLWWSPWFLLLFPAVLLWSIPTGWAYWVLGQPLSPRSLARRSDLVVLAVVATVLWLGVLPDHVRVYAYLLVGVAALTTLFSVKLQWSQFKREFFEFFGFAQRSAMQQALDDVNAARRRVSAQFKSSLVVLALVVVVASIDTLGATIHVIFTSEGLVGLFASVASVLGAFAVYGRQLLTLFNGNRRKGRPAVSMSILAWAAAVIVVGAWLVAVNAGSHAIAWGFNDPSGYPAGVLSVEAPTLTQARELLIEERPNGRAVRAVMPTAAAASSQPYTDRNALVATVVLGLLASLALVLGNNRSFVNLSSMHNFYAQRLTRAYLGATNEKRLGADNKHVTDVIDGDDVPADDYWLWPKSRNPVEGIDRVVAEVKAAASWVVLLPMRIWRYLVPAPARSNHAPVANNEPQRAETAGHHGAPLHIVNVTINETFNNRSGIQQQDRKGVPLAIGAAGFSVGVRHHLVADATYGHIALPKSGAGHKVFDTLEEKPEILSLGRWASISGAAMSSAAGSRTSLPMALLATFANVRLGYWWDSGLKRAARGWMPEVYQALFAECLADLRGTGDRLWNLTDGGHFENLGGYELIRRRLPLIVLIDAEQDPDYKFAGLAELVRKARLDFGAEIEFDHPVEHLETRGLFESCGLGPLAKLRRVEASKDKRPSPTGLELSAQREGLSSAHAAVATVTYLDGRSPPSWLIYVKATLMGDEPLDVLEYHSSHPDFPHESTANQFFDEAQWESYRRLGQHIGRKVLSDAVFDLAKSSPKSPKASTDWDCAVRVRIQKP